MDNQTIKTHLTAVIDIYMKSEKDKKHLLLQDVFVDDNKEIYRLIGIIR